MSRERADQVAARATGIGIGLAVLMVTWLVGNRLAGLLWDPPLGPSVAIAAAAAAGGVTAVVAARRLGRTSGGSRPKK